MNSYYDIPVITIEPEIVFYEDENPKRLMEYMNQVDNTMKAWEGIIHTPGFIGCEFDVGKEHIMLTHSVRDTEYQLSFMVNDIPIMHENYDKNLKGVSENLLDRLSTYSLGRSINVHLVTENL